MLAFIPYQTGIVVEPTKLGDESDQSLNQE
jgi:hypothetical protein